MKWDQILDKKIKAPFVPRDILKVKYIKDNIKTLKKGEEPAKALYLADTRFFSQRFTAHPTGKLQNELNEMMSGKALPFVEDCWLDIKADLDDAANIRTTLSEYDDYDALSYNSTCDTSIMSSNASECLSY